MSRLWGPEQQILGPFLVVPYTVRLETMQGDKRIEVIQERREAFTPETLEAVGRADSKTLQRSIFEVPVYAARLTLSGRFAVPAIGDAAADAVSVRWRDAAFVLSLSGVSGLKEAAVLKIASGADIPFSPSIGIPERSGREAVAARGSLNGIHAKLGGAVVPDPEGCSSRSRRSSSMPRRRSRAAPLPAPVPGWCTLSKGARQDCHRQCDGIGPPGETAPGRRGGLTVRAPLGPAQIASNC